MTLAFLRKPDSTAVAFFVAGSFWFLVGTTYGIFSAIQLMAPGILDNVPPIVFGRTRPSHVNTVVFGFVGTLLLGAAHHYIPRLLRAPLWSEPLGWATFALWTITVLSGPISFGLGMSQGREYAEYLWPFDLTLLAALVLLFVNLTMTAARRRAKVLYVSIWYLYGSLIAMTASYAIGNVIWHPATGAMTGILDSIFLWFYAHNLVGLLLTPTAIAAAYFVVPRVTRTPLYSHVLSLAGFWTLVIFYTHIGGHHIIQAPIPNWVKTLAVMDSVAMFIPVAIFLFNIWLTMRGKIRAIWHDIGGRFVLLGTLWYLLTCLQGPFQSLPSVQKITHFTNWVIGHSHIAVLGFSGFIALGALWHALPSAVGRELYWRKIPYLQFGLAMLGLGGFFLVLTIAGLIQGANWYHNGETEYRVIPDFLVYMVLRALFGLSLITAALLGFLNVVFTVWGGRPRPEASP